MFYKNFKKIEKYIIITLIIFFLLVFIFNMRDPFETFENFDNSHPYKKQVIPNIVHYILFDQYQLNFASYLSLSSTLKVQKPEKVYVHSNLKYLNGTFWERIQKLANYTKTEMTINYMAQPTHVYGQPLSSTFHATDVARIIVLQRWGGIYLDSDVLILRNLEPFRYYEMVVGWPENKYMGTQVLLLLLLIIILAINFFLV